MLVLEHCIQVRMELNGPIVYVDYWNMKLKTVEREEVSDSFSPSNVYSCALFLSTAKHE